MGKLSSFEIEAYLDVESCVDYLIENDYFVAVVEDDVMAMKLVEVVVAVLNMVMIEFDDVYGVVTLAALKVMKHFVVVYLFVVDETVELVG